MAPKIHKLERARSSVAYINRRMFDDDAWSGAKGMINRTFEDYESEITSRDQTIKEQADRIHNLEQSLSHAKDCFGIMEAEKDATIKEAVELGRCYRAQAEEFVKTMKYFGARMDALDALLAKLPVADPEGMLSQEEHKTLIEGMDEAGLLEEESKEYKMKCRPMATDGPKEEPAKEKKRCENCGHKETDVEQDDVWMGCFTGNPGECDNWEPKEDKQEVVK